jgi:hypothetical protein
MVVTVDQVVVEQDFQQQLMEDQAHQDKDLMEVKEDSLIHQVFMEVVEVEVELVLLELMEKKDRMYLDLQEMEVMAKHIQSQELLHIMLVEVVEVIGVMIYLTTV